jgi:formylglycine-generating enzyme required for sulfatase activity
MWHLLQLRALYSEGVLWLFIFSCCLGFLGCGKQESPRTPTQEEPVVQNSIGMEFVWIPPGQAVLGSPDSEAFRSRLQEVSMFWTWNWTGGARGEARPELDGYFEKYRIYRQREGFYMGITEVTNAQFRMFKGEHVCKLALDQMNPQEKGPAEPWQMDIGLKSTAVIRERELSINGNDQPVSCVMPREARAFCEWLGNQPAEVSAGRSYRLPTKEEWEYACRAGTTGRFYWKGGVEQATRYENVASGTEGMFHSWVPDVFPNDDHRIVAAPVGSFLPNPWGLYDMLGNVMEITEGEYELDAPVGEQSDGPSEVVMLKGGSWTHGQWITRAAYEWAMDDDDGWLDIGFRVVLMQSKDKVFDGPKE